MKTVQMTLDEDLLKSVDQAVKKLQTSRSAFTRDALRLSPEHLSTTLLENNTGMDMKNIQSLKMNSAFGKVNRIEGKSEKRTGALVEISRVR